MAASLALMGEKILFFDCPVTLSEREIKKRL